MSLENVPDRIWFLLIGLVIFAITLWLYQGWNRAERVLNRVTTLITVESPHYCGTCMLTNWEFSLPEDHFPPWLHKSADNMRQMPYGTAYITDHEYHPVYLVDIAKLTRDPESWEQYGRHLHLRSPRV